MMGVTDESNDVANSGQMPDMISDDLIERVGVGGGVADKTFVVMHMVATELHFRIEREVFAVLLQWLHVVTEGVVCAA